MQCWNFLGQAEGPESQVLASQHGQRENVAGSKLQHLQVGFPAKHARQLKT
jgi:hypothetical protein